VGIAKLVIYVLIKGYSNPQTSYLGFLWVLRFPPPIITEILLKVALNTISQSKKIYQIIGKV
jgi:hypothetical protein